MLDGPLVTVALPIVNAAIMCGIGMTLRPTHFGQVFHRPRAIAVGVFGHYVFLPLLGFLFAAVFSDSFGHAVGFVLLAACPSASISNVLAFLGRGNVALAVTLSAICALVTLISVPLLVNLAIDWFGGEAHALRLPVGRTVAQLAILILLPVIAGMAIGRHAPGFAARAEPWIGRISLLFLATLVVIIVIGNAELVRDSIARLGPATLAMCTAAIASGLLLARIFRLPTADAITIGMEVGVQNCMLAMLVALTLLRMPEVALPAATYGLTMFIPAFALVWIGRRLSSTRQRAERSP